jgi:hypothetical protein
MRHEDIKLQIADIKYQNSDIAPGAAKWLRKRGGIVNRRILAAVLCLAVLAGASFATDDQTVGGGRPDSAVATRRPDSLVKGAQAEAGGWGFLGPYVAMPSYTDLNAHLSTLGFGAFDQYQFMFGGGGMALVDGVTIGGYGFGGSQSVVSDSINLRLTSDYGGGMFEVGWLPLSTRHFKIGPALGIGGVGFTIAGSRLNNQSPSFDSLLLRGGQSWQISNGGFVLAPAVNVLIPISWTGLYLKVGYLFVPSDQSWSLSGGTPLTHGPALHSSGVFAALQLMLGGSTRSNGAKLNLNGEFNSDDSGQGSK